MAKIKLDKNIKQLLDIYKVPTDVVTLIEDYYSGLLNEVSQEFEGEIQKREQKKPKTPTTQEIAKKARLIK